MKRIILLIIGFLVSCQSNAGPQSLEDLLALTDHSDESICTLALDQVRSNLTSSELEEFSATDLDAAAVAKAFSDDPVSQILVVYRRAALRRRLNVETDNVSFAEQFYREFDDKLPNPTSLAEHDNKLGFWAERLTEQRQFEDNSTDEFNLRFCVINEARANAHADSRAFLLSGVSDGTLGPAPQVFETINRETYFGEDFKAAIFAELLTEENLASLSALERAKFRGDESILFFDPDMSDAFWVARDKEIEALLSHISDNKYESVAMKLADMVMIDQSLRKLWMVPPTNSHFQNPDEYEAFKKEVGPRVMKVDEFNTAQMQAMLMGRGWFRDDKDGHGAGRNAWLIAQHADRNPDFQQDALKLIEAELGSPGVSKSNYAYLYDRVQIRFIDRDDGDGRMQRYGTQGRCTGLGSWEPLPMEDPGNINIRRAEVGLGSIEEYKGRFKTMCLRDER